MFLSTHGRVKRPMNAFMLFAKDYRQAVQLAFPEKNNKDISTHLGKMWSDLPPAPKVDYVMEAKRLEAIHKSIHPNYVYSPGSRRKEGRKRCKPMLSRTGRAYGSYVPVFPKLDQNHATFHISPLLDRHANTESLQSTQSGLKRFLQVTPPKENNLKIKLKSLGNNHIVKTVCTNHYNDINSRQESNTPVVTNLMKIQQHLTPQNSTLCLDEYQCEPHVITNDLKANTNAAKGDILAECCRLTLGDLSKDETNADAATVVHQYTVNHDIPMDVSSNQHSVIENSKHPVDDQCIISLDSNDAVVFSPSIHSGLGNQVHVLASDELGHNNVDVEHFGSLCDDPLPELKMLLSSPTISNTDDAWGLLAQDLNIIPHSSPGELRPIIQDLGYMFSRTDDDVSDVCTELAELLLTFESPLTTDLMNSQSTFQKRKKKNDSEVLSGSKFNKVKRNLMSDKRFSGDNHCFRSGVSQNWNAHKIDSLQHNSSYHEDQQAVHNLLLHDLL